MALILDLFVRKRLTYQDLNNKIQIPIQNYINQKCVIQDEVSADIAANKIVRRDALGRVKLAAPEEPEHGARKADVDAVAAEVEAIAAITPRVAYGTYIGTGGQRTIEVGFTPYFVYIYNSREGCASLAFKSSGRGIRIKGDSESVYASTNQYATAVPVFTSSGFKVGTNPAGAVPIDLNYPSTTYEWIAIGV